MVSPSLSFLIILYGILLDLGKLGVLPTPNYSVLKIVGCDNYHSNLGSCLAFADFIFRTLMPLDFKQCFVTKSGCIGIGIGIGNIIPHFRKWVPRPSWSLVYCFYSFAI